ncbi:MAG: AAA family ATPase [Actinomycetota bacterium]
MPLSESALDALRAPNSVARLGVPEGLVEDLFMRRVLTERSLTIGEAARALCIAHQTAMELAEALRSKAMLEFLGATGRDYRIQLTELGHHTTSQRMAGGHHVGPVPVSLADYEAVVAAQAAVPKLDRQTMRQAFSDLIVEDGLLDQIGPAFVSGGAIFLYGPPGTGKTSLAERLNRVVSDPVLIPRFVEIDGRLISVYDPSLHVPLETQPAQVDHRYVLCERPLIVVGGELDRRMLDLSYDRISGTHTAPVQMLANNGILVVDDFGRQAVRPDELLNRWIVPLSRGIDYLQANGSKFSVPFELKLVVSTNLDPNSLGDDAFLRRLRNKVFVGPISDHAFHQVLTGAAAARGITVDPTAADHLAEVARREIGELRPYLPVDFCQLTGAICDYEQIEQRLDVAMVERVADLYFVQGEAEEMEDRRLDPWDLPGAPLPAPVPDEYETVPAGGENILDGLEALAMTQSVDGLENLDSIPTALRPEVGYGN